MLQLSLDFDDLGFVSCLVDPVLASFLLFVVVADSVEQGSVREDSSALVVDVGFVLG